MQTQFAATVEDVLVTEQLAQRASRAPNFEAENRALVRLGQALGDAPQRILEILVGTTLELCRAESSGISILENEAFFRWQAVAGRWASFVNGGMPRELSPCGTVLDRGESLLFSEPGRFYPGLAQADPPVVEALLVPFQVRGETIGTLWIVTHDPGHKFDAEDARLLTNVAQFASAAYQMNLTQQTLRDNENRKDEFLATLSHELRNPLTPLSAAIDILRLTQGAPSNPTLPAMMAVQVEHLVTLVNDLLEVSRITSGKIELQLEQIDLATTIEHAVSTTKPLLERARHHLTVSIPEPISIIGDPIRLVQAFTNVLNNASKFTPDGGQIWLTATRDGHHAVISVRDNGIGISAEMIARVFEMFTQVKNGHGGLGIGLGLTRKLLALHDGSIEARSDGLGSGTEFSIRLPLVAAAIVQPTPLASDVPAQCRVLVVDDDAAVGDSVAQLLCTMGFQARAVYGGLAALEELDTRPVDVALLDLGMPGMDGFELARRIRGRRSLDRVRLIALSGWGGPHTCRALDAGFDHHFLKPLDLRALLPVLEPARDRSDS